jgi:hypothetical protein
MFMKCQKFANRRYGILVRVLPGYLAGCRDHGGLLVRRQAKAEFEILTWPQRVGSVVLEPCSLSSPATHGWNPWCCGVKNLIRGQGPSVSGRKISFTNYRILDENAGLRQFNLISGSGTAPASSIRIVLKRRKQRPFCTFHDQPS